MLTLFLPFFIFYQYCSYILKVIFSSIFIEHQLSPSKSPHFFNVISNWKKPVEVLRWYKEKYNTVVFFSSLYLAYNIYNTLSTPVIYLSQTFSWVKVSGPGKWIMFGQAKRIQARWRSEESVSYSPRAMVTFNHNLTDFSSRSGETFLDLLQFTLLYR